MNPRLLIHYKILIFFLTFRLLSPQIKFAWITDTHIGSPDAEKDLVQVVNDINKQNVKFSIITGDVTEKGSNSELILAKEILDKLNQPYFIIPGNHDTKWSESGCTKFTEIFGDNKFIFYYSDYCFIGMNSGIPLRGGGGHIAPNDIEWLKSKLNKLDINTKIFLAVHHQLDNEIDNYKEIIHLLSRFRKVFIIVGHGHTNKIYNFNGLKGAMGRSSLSRGKNPGYNIVSLFSDSISIKTIDFSENKEWFRHSIERNELFNQEEEASQVEKSIKNIKLIFDAKNTVVKTGTISGGKLFLADLSGNIYSLDLNGKLIWKKYFPTSFFARPIAYKNRIVFCGTDGNLYFLNHIKGKLTKVIKLSTTIIASPIIHKNILIAFTNDGKINFINLKSFEITSKKIAEKNFEAIPLIAGDQIIIGNWDNFLYSLKLNLAESQIINWKWTENKNFYYSPAACNPVIDNRKRVYISTPDKYISAIEFESGKTIFRSNNFNSWESIGIDEEKSLLFIKGLVDTLYAINIKDSTIELRWKTFLGNGIDTNPVSITEKFGLVFVPSKDGRLYIIKKQNGELIDKIFLGNARLNDAVIYMNKDLIISNMDGKIFKIKINRK